MVMGLPIPSGCTSEGLSGQPLPLSISTPLPEGFLQQPSASDGGFGV